MWFTNNGSSCNTNNNKIINSNNVSNASLSSGSETHESELSEYYSVTSLSVSSELINDELSESYQTVDEVNPVIDVIENRNKNNDANNTIIQSDSKLENNFDDNNITEQTTEDFQSSQIFDYEPHHLSSRLILSNNNESHVGDYRYKFNKCLRFFNKLSNQQKHPIFPSKQLSNNHSKPNPQNPFKIDENFNKIDLLNQWTNTEIESLDEQTQTDFSSADKNDDLNYGIVYENQLTDPITKNGDSYKSNSSTCTGAYAITINNDSGEQFTSEVQASDYLTAFREASVDSLTFALNSLIPQDNELVPQNLHVNLSIKCSALHPAMYKNSPPTKVQLTHISPDSSPSPELNLHPPLFSPSPSVFSETPESIDSSHGKIYVATPIILHSPTQLNVCNSISAHQPLHSMFLKTSTPVHTIRRAPQPHLVRRCVSAVQPKHLPLSLTITHPNPDPISNNNSNNKSPSLSSSCYNTRRRTTATNNSHDTNKCVYLSLYNLTCDSFYNSPNNQCHYDPILKSPIQNPTNVFFNNSKSYCSLKETDLDTGKEELKCIFKETDLDEYNFNMNASSKSFSLNHFPSKQTRPASSSLPKSRTPNPYLSPSCVEFDEDLLNTTDFNSPPPHLSSSSLASRLYRSAHSPAQLRVAKSITKLNIPSWLDSVQFPGDKQLPQPSTPSLYPSTAPSTPFNSMRSLKLQKSQTLCFSPPTHAKSPKITLPSLKYASKQSKSIQPIHETKARKILNKSKPTKTDSKSQINELSQLFSSEFEPQLTHNSYCNFRRNKTLNINHLGRVCCRVLCSHLIQETDLKLMINCEYCSAIYCSYQCHSIDKVAHKAYCDYGTYHEWLESIFKSLSDSQIKILHSIFDIGWSNLGKGLVKWRIDEQNHSIPSSSASSISEAPFYMKLTKSQLSEYRIEQKLKSNRFPLSLISLPKSSKVPILITKYLAIPRSNDCSPDRSPMTNVNQSYLMNHNMSNSNYNKYNNNNNSNISKLSIQKRQMIVSKIKSDLEKYSVNIYSNYPHITDSLNDYLVNGNLFQSHQIFLPNSNSLITIKPDYNIEVTELL